MFLLSGNLQKYQACLKVYELGSFSAAAVALNCSQSNISRMVKDLEHTWQFKLFDRQQKRLALTLEGQQIWPHLKQIVADAEALQKAVTRFNHVATGTLRIGVFSSIATHILPEIIQCFQQDYPQIKFELLLGDYVEIEAWLLADRIDFGFIRSTTSTELRFEPLFMDELLAVLPAADAAVPETTFPIQRFDHAPFILLQRHGNSEVAQLLAHYHLQPDIRLTTWDDATIIAMVESGLGLAILNSLILKRIPFNVCLKPLTPPQYWQVGIATHQNRKLSTMGQAFLSCVQKQAALHPPVITAINTSLTP